MTAGSLSRRLILAAGASVLVAVGAKASVAASGDADGAALNRLIAESGKADRALDPVEAMRDAATPFVDPLSDAYRDALQRRRTAELAALERFDRTRLSDVDRLAYDVFRYKTEESLTGFSSGVFEIERMTPLDPSFGLQVTFSDAVAGAKLATEADYQACVARMAAFADYMTGAIRRLEEGRARGYLQPKIMVVNVIAEIDTMLAQPVRDTPFYKPALAPAPTLSTSDQDHVRAAFIEVITARVLPAYAGWKRYLTETYLPAGRDAPGLCAMKDGAQVYAAALKHHTTTDLSADDIHALGLSEVSRIRAELETVHATIGYPGDLQAFFQHVRSDPSFYYSRPEDLLARFRAIEARIWLGMPRLFNRRPKAPFEVRPLPAMGEARGTGYYTLGPPDGASPGVLYFNMSMLGTRPIPTLETLTLHEGIPGHHFQGSLAQENTALPDILRFGGGFTAYIEGWGLYSESLGRALGMFTDPYQWFGHLDFEMLRAVRLVVDTGMHAKAWSRDRAIDYMTANTSMAAKDIRVEIDRYIAAPGQATAYKVGELKLLELRDRAERKLGARYDIRDFHDQVLMTGSMPLAILEAKIDAWIAAGGPKYQG